MRPIQRFDATGFPVGVAAEIPGNVQPDADPYRTWGKVASREAMIDAFGGDRADDTPVAVIVGSALGGMSAFESGVNAGYASVFLFPWSGPSLADEIAARIGGTASSIMINSSFVSGADAIGMGARRIREGLVDVVIAGASEAPITPLVVSGLSSLGALSDGAGDPAGAIRPFDRYRRGCGLGEGAAFLVLEERDHALARGANIHAELIGYGTAMDAFHITQLPNDGVGLRLAMSQAIADAGVSPVAVGYINAHGTGTDMNDRVETAVIRDVFGGHAWNVPVSSTKAVTGHLLGAAGALEAVITILALESHVAPPTINWSTRDPDCDLDYVPNQSRELRIDVAMSNSMGFGGHSAALIFATDHQRRDGCRTT